MRGQVPAFAARQPVVVSGTGDTTVTMTLRPLGTLSGRIVTERAPNAPAPTASLPRVVLEPANGSPALGLVRISSGPDGPTETFTAEGLRAGPYVVRINTYGGWMIKSIAWRGRDYTDQPFDFAATTDVADVVVTVTNDPPVTTGVVRDERGRPVPNAAVLAFPADRTLWTNYGFSPTRLKMTRASSRGEYRHHALAAGSYLIVAIPGEAADGWTDPAFLERAAGLATQITLSWGAARTQDLVLRAVR